jgi:hypothetical protein
MASWLAKRLAGAERADAYRIKSHAISSLIIGGWARVNGLRVNGTVALEFQTDPLTRLHIPLRHLAPEARSRIMSALGSVPAVASLFELSNLAPLFKGGSK